MAQDPIDPVVGVLLRSPLSPQQRRAASEAFSSSANEDDLQDKMIALNLPKHVRAELWDLKAASPVQSAPEPSGPEGSALGRFASGVGEMINPVTIAKGLYNTARHPIDTAGNILSAANEQRLKAHEEFDQGNYGQGAARSVAAALPIVGPMAAEIGEQIRDGDSAGGFGKAVGLVAPMAVMGAMRKSPANAAVKADALERGAVQQVAEKVLSPKDRKYQAMAPDAAKELLKRGVQGDRIAIQQWADDLIADAGSRIDEVIDSYASTDTLQTKPVIDMLDQTLKTMEFKRPQPPKNPMQGTVTNAQGQPVTLPSSSASPQVNPVLQGVYAEIKAQRDFVAQRGPSMTFEDMRRLRQQLDGIGQTAKARAKVAGDMSLDAVERATSEAGNSIRRQIAAERPELAGPNADMHLGLAVRDILDPAKGRPSQPPSATTGATGGLHTTAALIGANITNIPLLKPIATYVAVEVIPKLREAQVSPQNQLRLAQHKFKLAQALKEGKAGAAQGILRVIASYVPGLTGVGRITEPSGAPQ